MKTFFAFVMFLFSSCVNGKDITYAGSTPVNNTIRNFFGIPLADSIDFMRWQIIFHVNEYTLTCNYGIGKPNTNGFINGGKRIELNGQLNKTKHQYVLKYNDKALRLVALNDNLVHLLDETGALLVGNGGWSYTLSSEHPSASDVVNIETKQTALKDSMVFQGRTPCLRFEKTKINTDCYKLKWWIVLYANSKTNRPAGYYMNGTVLDHKGKTGQWFITTAKGRVIYQLNADNGDAIYLLKLDDNILVFADKTGNLLTGNEDFSFTLNRKN